MQIFGYAAAGFVFGLVASGVGYLLYRHLKAHKWEPTLRAIWMLGLVVLLTGLAFMSFVVAIHYDVQSYRQREATIFWSALNVGLFMTVVGAGLDLVMSVARGVYRLVRRTSTP